MNNSDTVNQIDLVFEQLQRAGETALIPFITVGDPDPNTTVEILKQVELAGADMVELGVPYSDPLADGPVIQRASLRALEHRMTLQSSIEVGAKARQAGVKIPFILFSYFNPVLQMGIETCFRTLQERGFSGMLIPDLPLEESAEVHSIAQQYNIHLIPLVAPTSKERIAKITKHASGFIYCVSSLGVTGMRSSFDAEVESFIRSVKEASSLPAAVGFGISNREHVKTFSEYCEGVIVGSAIVRKIEEVEPLLSEASTREEGLAEIRKFVSELKL